MKQQRCVPTPDGCLNRWDVIKESLFAEPSTSCRIRLHKSKDLLPLFWAVNGTEGKEVVHILFLLWDLLIGFIHSSLSISCILAEVDVELMITLMTQQLGA